MKLNFLERMLFFEESPPLESQGNRRFYIVHNIKSKHLQQNQSSDGPPRRSMAWTTRLVLLEISLLTRLS